MIEDFWKPRTSCTIAETLFTQSWTKLVETNAVSERISPFLCMETPTRSQKHLSSPPPLHQCCLEGLTNPQGFFGGKATLIWGRGGKICCGKWFSRPKFSFIPKCLNIFAPDCRFYLDEKVSVDLQRKILLKKLRNKWNRPCDKLPSVCPFSRENGQVLNLSRVFLSRRRLNRKNAILVSKVGL